jgi:hypothetical protein
MAQASSADREVPARIEQAPPVPVAPVAVIRAIAARVDAQQWLTMPQARSPLQRISPLTELDRIIAQQEEQKTSIGNALAALRCIAGTASVKRGRGRPPGRISTLSLRTRTR